MHIIITTPKPEIETSNKELQAVLESKDGYFFRTYHFKPKAKVGERLYEIENNKIVGFGIIFEVKKMKDTLTCGTTEREWGESGDWIIKYNKWHDLEKPISMKGIQGIRYVEKLKDTKIKDELLSMSARLATISN